MMALRKRELSLDFVFRFLLWLAAWLMPARKGFAAAALGRGETLRLSLDVARVLGADEALMLQKMHDWLEYNKSQRRNYHSGRTWTYNTYEAWQRDHFGWLSVSSVKRILLKLERSGVLLSGHFGAPGDRTKWYTINYQKLSALLVDGRPIVEQSSDQNGLMVGSKRADDSTNKKRKQSQTANKTETPTPDARARDVDGDDVSLCDTGEESLTKEPETPRFEDDRHAKADYAPSPSSAAPLPQNVARLVQDYALNPTTAADYVTKYGAAYADRVAVVARQGSAPAGLWRALLDRGDYKDAAAGSRYRRKVEGNIDDFIIK